MLAGGGGCAAREQYSSCAWSALQALLPHNALHYRTEGQLLVHIDKLVVRHVQVLVPVQCAATSARPSASVFGKNKKQQPACAYAETMPRA